MEVIRFQFDNELRRSEARKIRTEVFIVEQNVPEEIEYDEFELSAQHYLLLSEGEAIATARWRKTEKGIKLERFAMIKKFRNKGYGSILLDTILEDVIPLKRKVYLHAQLAAKNYYARKGFEEFGDQFIEAGIKHISMQYIPNNRA